MENEKNLVIGNDKGINIIDMIKGEEVKPALQSGKIEVLNLF
jgi:hypothetical protein